MACIAATAASLVAGVAVAQEPDAGPVTILADSLMYDEDAGLITAAGAVEIANGQYTVLAARIAYDLDGDRAHATGQVVLHEPDGDVIFADEMILSGSLRDGFISGIRVLMADRSRMAAARAIRRSDGHRTELVNAVYTACETCGGNASPPVWQLKASSVVHDQEFRRVEYRNVRLEFLGIPILYLPFFSHPDPTVPRQSGFLTPTYVANRHLGADVEIPYFLAIAPHMDATLAPRFTSREGVILAGEYRQRTHTGRFRAEASLTRPERPAMAAIERDFRGHARASGRFAIDPTWRWGFDAATSTDDTYLRRYGISSETTLVNNAFAEGIDGRSYAAVDAWAFQGLREEDAATENPLVLPLLEYSTVSPPGPQGQTVMLEASVLSLTRSTGANSVRLSTTGAWRLPYTGPWGDVYALAASLRGDAYVVSRVPHATDPNAGTESAFVGRALPQVGLQWRLPLTRPGAEMEYVLEPVAAVVVAPHGGNPARIPNEDSRSFEFDDTNLFSFSRLPGLDVWEGGPRIDFGLRLGAFGPQSAITALVGQTVRDRPSPLFDEDSGLRAEVSDYVGRIDVDLGDLDYTHRFRMGRESFLLLRNEIELKLGTEDLRFAARYVFLDEKLSTEGPGQREELSFSGRAVLSEEWSVTARSRHDLTEDGSLLLAEFGLVYECDCLTVAIQLTRRLTRDRDVLPSTSIRLQIRPRNLG